MRGWSGTATPWHYRRYSTKYVPEEDQARAAQAGIWAAEFVPPWA